MQYKNPRNRQLVKEALQKAGRTDLIGSGEKCLLKISDGRRPFNGSAKRSARPKKR